MLAAAAACRYAISLMIIRHVVVAAAFASFRHMPPY